MSPDRRKVIKRIATVSGHIFFAAGVSVAPAIYAAIWGQPEFWGRVIATLLVTSVIFGGISFVAFMALDEEKP